jgi:hypothetical protein
LPGGGLAVVQASRLIDLTAKFDLCDILETDLRAVRIDLQQDLLELLRLCARRCSNPSRPAGERPLVTKTKAERWDYLDDVWRLFMIGAGTGSR